MVGLRGTGSDSYKVENLFVPAAYTAARDRPEERREPGTLYRFSSLSMYAAGFGGVALGLARAMLDDFIELAQSKVPTAQAKSLRDNPVIQAHLIQCLRDIYDDVRETGAVSLDQRVTIRMASTYAIHQARDVRMLEPRQNSTLMPKALQHRIGVDSALHHFDGDLLLDRNGRVRSLLQNLDPALTACKLRLRGLVEIRTKLCERGQLAVLCQLQAKGTRNRSHRLDLRAATHAAYRETDVNRGTDVGVEQIAFEINLPVGNRNDIRRDVG